jgi:hypothetical protein
VNCKSNKTKDKESLSYLIDKNLSQSDCIKIGNGIEYIFADIILNYNKNLVSIKQKNIKDKKERDHLFLDEKNKIIYYAELKSNLNLDTEKCKSTSEKCITIENELKKEYPDYKINMYLVGNRYYETKIIPKHIMKKYNVITFNVIGVNNYFNELSINYKFNNENEYKSFLNYMANKMFDT